jgi:hypothetical protein
MFNRLKHLFGAEKKEPSQALAPAFDEKAAQEWYEHKSRLMENILGKQHDIVMHAIFPYAIGGGLDLYYYPHGIPGTAVATKELSELPNVGSKNEKFSCYELVMFTRHPCDLDEAKDQSTAFGKAHSNINGILNVMAPFSASATLNPNETCEFPADMKSVGGKCFILDSYGSRGDEVVQNFGIMVIIEISRKEMEFARANGGVVLLEKLKLAGHYPYSDLGRDPVV